VFEREDALAMPFRIAVALDAVSRTVGSLVVPARAYEAHHHGAVPLSVSKSIASCIEVASGTFELTAILRNGKMASFLDCSGRTSLSGAHSRKSGRSSAGKLRPTPKTRPAC
jgi:hypothetical protein